MGGWLAMLMTKALGKDASRVAGFSSRRLRT